MTRLSPDERDAHRNARLDAGRGESPLVKFARVWEPVGVCLCVTSRGTGWACPVHPRTCKDHVDDFGGAA